MSDNNNNNMVLYEALLKLRNTPDMDFVSVILDHCTVFTDTKNPQSYVMWDNKARRYRVSVNEETVKEGVDATMRDIVHEVLHVVYNHFDDKYKEGDKNKWNQAVDCIVNSNPFLSADPKWIENKCTFKTLTGGKMNAKDHTSRDIYEFLVQQEEQQPEQPQGPQSHDDHSQMKDEGDPGEGDGDQDGDQEPQQSDRPKNLVEMLGDEKAKEVAQSIGTKEVMDEVTHLIQSAKGENMKREISNCLKRGNIKRTNILRPTRRPLTAPFGRRQIKNKLSIVIDTSGSMVCDPQMLELISHTFQECKKIGDVEVFMGDCSPSAHYKDCKTLPELKGGGGSNFEWLKDIQSDQLIFITDGYITDDSDCDVCSLVVVRGNPNLRTTARQVRC